ncbi:LysR family transcriptional regulator [Aetokthonos hydrillicola Thurmond2011]|jgi:DNA-binding transcriptional LysR family regulator|uniref:LysR family transcriptional regulator n=1 Tax=Aetokthonos hydrillicola Thurmond2011 TaxID=2712845 RepID=A0AAP5IAD8_9CYAN|nr:LysR family transcriptional regulator [Aetokthonos hydrillicola]MBW4586060.1 LysR family transcriptional regulator [Aetokthonos hydrillicola CCALA 1050]MDR9897880.1 LysR family transcriptional regulator [Aetokthonos hydrillicola Thurmond2011]
MTLDQLEIFLAVAQHMHITRAADALYITQSSVSAVIQNLEQKYGVKLFHRIGRRIEITQAGMLLQVEAQKILNAVALCERGLRELNNLQQGELRLGTSQTIGNYWLPYFISKFKRQYSGIRINCTLGNTQQISTGTVKGLFDLGFVEGEFEPSLRDCLEQRVVGGDRLAVVVGKSHPWFERQSVELSELSKTVWVMREKGSGTRQRFEKALQDSGVELAELTAILEMSTGEMVKAAVESGVGVAAISELMVNKELQLGTIREISIIDFADITRQFVLLKHRERFSTRVSQVFEQILLTS